EGARPRKELAAGEGDVHASTCFTISSRPRLALLAAPRAARCGPSKAGNLLQDARLQPADIPVHRPGVIAVLARDLLSDLPPVHSDGNPLADPMDISPCTVLLHGIHYPVQLALQFLTRQALQIMGLIEQGEGALVPRSQNHNGPPTSRVTQ